MNAFRTVVAGLLLLTVVALLPWSPAGPFDVRDYTPLDGVSLAYPLWAAPFEPLLALYHVVTGAPDFRLSILATLGWVALAGLAWGWRAGRRGGGRLRALGYGVWTGAAVATLTLGYLAAAVVLDLPGWRLEVRDPDWRVADLQSHTHASHDGVASPQRNFAWHTARGYDLVAVTEHNDPQGAFAARRLARETGGPALIPGVEVNSEQEEFLLGLGLREDLPVLRYRGNEADYARRFIADVHERHGGAVIAMAWKITPAQVRRLAELGIDGIELVNTGHPDVPDAVREAMLEVVRSHDVIPVASTDWHGWSGFTRTWTLVRTPSDVDPAAWAVERLRGRDAAAIVPVAAGRIGEPGLWRVVLAPAVEAVRYAGELSLPRVAAWWAWAALATAAVTALRRRGRRAVPAFAATASLAVTAFLAVAYVRLLTLPAEAPGTEYGLEMAGHLEPLLLLCAAFTTVAVWRLRGR